jgi:NADH-quinone oxidoreductase subunit G
MKLTLDGQELEVAPGTTVLQAALAQGQVIPHYCYHPGLSIAGNCRMCLVEVEKAPKLMIACATQVTDGMVVQSQSARVKKAQAAVMEFLLINHPLDCTICDEAGECRLQEYAVAHGRGGSRYEEPKLLLSKAVDIGEHIMLDQERCIQCSRCTRFCDEVTKTRELAFFQRSERTMIGIYPGKRLDNLYSGNVVDICPVGALTLKEFRFATRVWYLKHTPSVCAACTRGCNVLVAVGRQPEMWTTRGQFDDRIKRIVPRVNESVNGHWMCDIGRLSYERLQAAPRLDAASEGAGGRALDWDEAVVQALSRLRPAAAAGRAAAIFSPRQTSETIFAWRKLFSALGQVRQAVRRIERGEDDDLLLRRDRGGNARGASWILGEGASEQALLAAVGGGQIDALVVFGDPLDPADTLALEPALRDRLAELIYVGPFVDGGAGQASLLLPAAAWSEEDGTFVNFEGHVQWTRRCHLPRGEGRPGWRSALDVAHAAGIELGKWTSAGDVLRALAAEVAPFAGMNEERVGLLGIRGGAGAPAVA